MMTEIKISNTIPNLRKEIEQIQSELSNMGDVVSNIPELITSSNLLRSNESLVKSESKENRSYFSLCPIFIIPGGYAVICF